ncbi:MAG: HAD-IB family hydrolase [Succinivibrionaceae bacterium]|nr:HAD-IB family hydrolase [Ruminobacter sp.]MDY5779730.1 HAD-IB family hydrolase [Succinivibrionaceae bacterium]MEE1339974.1 HAD-IB family hydrolase [Succinivibrionaceae bacterium]
MSLAIFDLDGTILHGDSVTMFLNKMLEFGYIDASYRKLDDGLQEEFLKGTLDIMKYYRYMLKPFIDLTLNDLKPLIDNFITTQVLPNVYPEIKEIIAKKQSEGKTIVIASATTDLIVGPIAHTLGIENFVSTKVLYDKNNKIIGDVDPNICHKEGKIKHLLALCKEKGWNLDNSEGYGDTVNDIPMLSLTSKPYAVNPKADFIKYAKENNFQILNFK